MKINNGDTNRPTEILQKGIKYLTNSLALFKIVFMTDILKARYTVTDMIVIFEMIIYTCRINRLIIVLCAKIYRVFHDSFWLLLFSSLAIENVGEVPKGKDLANQFTFRDFPELSIL